MPWGRLDDKANDNPKLRLLSDPAWRLWGCGLIYCQAHLTDGFIPDGMIGEFGVKAKNIKAVADELCRSLLPGKGPLWHKQDGGYQVHDYLDWNPPRERILAERAQSEERLKRHKERRKNGVVNTVVNAVRNLFSDAEETATEQLSTTTYHVQDEKQERAEAQTRPPESERVNRLNTRIRQHRRRRSRETDTGRPAEKVITALARDVLTSHPNETDDSELRELLKTACARANLQYDGRTVGNALEAAKAQVRKAVG